MHFNMQNVVDSIESGPESCDVFWCMGAHNSTWRLLFERKISFFKIAYPCFNCISRWYRIKMLKIKVNTK
jgi:hypothetical protein